MDVATTYTQVLIPGQGYVIKGEPWFEDGTIVLVTQEKPTAFRIHRGVLSRHSEMFAGMLDIPQPAQSGDLFEGCQIVTMHDHPLDLENLLAALYDGPSFSNACIQDFFVVAGILRLSTKYLIEQLRRQAIQFLSIAWPYTLRGHDSMIETALSTPAVDSLTYPYVHPLHILNLATEVDSPVLIPSAVYFLSIYSLSDIIKADHPKLLVQHPSQISTALSHTDLISYSLMYQHRLKLLDTFVCHFCQDLSHKPTCGQVATCGKAFSRLVSQLRRFWSLKTGPLHFISQAMSIVSKDLTLCTMCRDKFDEDCSTRRQQLWDELPAVINLPPWDKLS